MHDNNYKRLFMVLLPELDGFAINNGKVNGNAIIEVQNGNGKATINITGLKPLDNTIYMVYFISSGDHGTYGVPIGTLKPDQKGRTSLLWEFNPNNVDKSNLPFEKFNVLAVIAKNLESSTGDIVAPLVGYKDVKVLWKAGFRESIKANSQVENVEANSAQPTTPEGYSQINKNVSKLEYTKNIKNLNCPCNTPINPNPDRKDAIFFTRAETKNIPTEQSALMNKLKNVMPFEQYDGADALLSGLASFVPEDIFTDLLVSISNLLDYIPDKDYSEFFKLINDVSKSTSGDQDGSLIELIETANQLAPRKVIESLLEAIKRILPELSALPTDKYSELIQTLNKAAELLNVILEDGSIQSIQTKNKSDGELEEVNKYATVKDFFGESSVCQSAEDSKIGLSNNNNDKFDLSSSSTNQNGRLDKDYDKKFRETLRNFSDEFNKIRDYNLPEDLGSEEITGIFNRRPSVFPFSLADAHSDSHEQADCAQNDKCGDQESENSFNHDEQETVPNTVEPCNKETNFYKYNDMDWGMPHHPNHNNPHKHGNFGPKPMPPFPGHNGFNPKPPHIPVPKPPFPPPHGPGHGNMPPFPKPPMGHPFPFAPGGDVKWARITDKDLNLLPSGIWQYIKNPFVALAYRKHKHLLLGMENDGGVRRYYFCVPGEFNQRDRKLAQSLGFNGFIPVDGGRPREGAAGYWVIEI